MCIICQGDYDEKMTELDCSNCPLITRIPDTLTSLTYLYCYGCPLLTHIPDTLTPLTILYRSNCPLLTHIPDTLTSLTYLDCSDYPLLSHIPDTLTSLTGLDCRDCPFLDHPQNPPAATNTSNLISLQWYIKKRVLANRIERIGRCRDLIELWWHPDAKGGWFAKQELLKEVSAM